MIWSGFAQVNIFDLAIKDNTFDVVVSHGVLHHTSKDSLIKISQYFKERDVPFVVFFFRYSENELNNDLNSGISVSFEAGRISR